MGPILLANSDTSQHKDQTRFSSRPLDVGFTQFWKSASSAEMLEAD
jgi:hypothetical protein